jgi:hypothetical protein
VVGPCGSRSACASERQGFEQAVALCLGVDLERDQELNAVLLLRVRRR